MFFPSVVGSWGQEETFSSSSAQWKMAADHQREVPTRPSDTTLCSWVLWMITWCSSIPLMVEFLTLSLRLSPTTAHRKLMSAGCVQHLFLSVTSCTFWPELGTQTSSKSKALLFDSARSPSWQTEATAWSMDPPPAASTPVAEATEGVGTRSGSVALNVVVLPWLPSLLHRGLIDAVEWQAEVVVLVFKTGDHTVCSSHYCGCSLRWRRLNSQLTRCAGLWSPVMLGDYAVQSFTLLLPLLTCGLCDIERLSTQTSSRHCFIQVHNSVSVQDVWGSQPHTPLHHNSWSHPSVQGHTEDRISCDPDLIEVR